MPTYKIQAPDGNTYQIDGPDGATDEQVQAEVIRQNPNLAQTKAPSPPAVAAQSPGLLQQYGQAVAAPLEAGTHFVSGVPASLAGGLAYLGRLGIDAAKGKFNPDQAKADQEGVQSALTYQPRTQGGKDTVKAGEDALSYIPQSANTLGEATADATGSPLLGSAVNAGLQGAAMLVGGKGLKGEPAPGTAVTKPGASMGLPSAPAVTPSVARQTFTDASKIGIRVTPKYAQEAGGTGGGTLGKAASQSGSEIKLQQALSQHNAGQVASAVADDFGLPKGTELSPQVLDGLQKQADNIYQVVRQTGDIKPTQADLNAIAQVGTKDKSLVSAITPEIKDLKAKLYTAGTQSADTVVSTINDLRDQARGNYKNPSATNEMRALGSAQMEAANAMEAMLERHLKTRPTQGLYDAFQKARTLRAKLASVRDAYNEATGTIDASSLAKDLDNNVPLSGNLRTIALAYKAFPKVLQKAERLPSSSGPTFVDQALMVGGAMGHHVLPMIAGAARPLGRAYVNSDRGQAGLFQAPQPGMLNQIANGPTAPFLFPASVIGNDPNDPNNPPQ